VLLLESVLDGSFISTGYAIPEEIVMLFPLTEETVYFSGCSSLKSEVVVFDSMTISSPATIPVASVTAIVVSLVFIAEATVVAHLRTIEPEA